MFELIGGLLYLIFIGAVWVGKMLIKLFIYTWPIQLCFVTFFLGGAAADAIWGDKYSETALEESYEIHITVHWENGEADSHLTVRRDLQWTTSEGKTYEDVFETNGAYDMYETTPYIPVKSGYRFLGLYGSPAGGSMIVSPGGYCVANLTADTELYALWEPIAAQAQPTPAAELVTSNILDMRGYHRSHACA